ncbi:helicase-related protein [Noviherbaspirillum aridicola]|uniref:Helicase C-terminal domain-containing protein n=1 Tax=Noviherbaspirillum aridicola TaxID=2849687 RepID=A0ABQ4Q073_9BURK|nr:helicase-related protein [Noviherbaspirillum aridicola]GIZ50155.1 hypothetical protein NCCP691_01690 [Noviherbaspirillum aridicola]
MPQIKALARTAGKPEDDQSPRRREIRRVAQVHGCKPCLLDPYTGRLRELAVETPGFYEQDPLCWVKHVRFTLPATARRPESWPCLVRVPLQLPQPRTESDCAALTGQVGGMLAGSTSAELLPVIAARIDDLFSVYGEDLTPKEAKNLASALRGVLARGVWRDDVLKSGFVRRMLAGPLRETLDRIDAGRAQALLKLEDYPQAFPLARRLGRIHHLHLGPTNSGKTHAALEALKQARSGVYLAPLRLLAMEVRDRLVASGVPCTLVTGEERIPMEGAAHTACTIEMLDPDTEAEVAVIDEVQMLANEQRGAAWTAALVGAPARHVYLCGGTEVKAACMKLIDALGEQAVEVAFERKTALVTEETPVSRDAGGIRRGDAVIAFSRRDILTLSARLRGNGFRVSTIYGALAPEVRRTEAARFLSGESDIVVATDAIGMGLNLPIRRVVFSASKKFDGSMLRPLTPVEVAQIAGRAGRMGMYEQGHVGAFEQAGLDHIREALSAPPQPFEGKLRIAPGLWQITALREILQTPEIGALLAFFAERIAIRSPLFVTASLREAIALGHRVDALAPDLPLAEKFVFSCAPVSLDSAAEAGYFDACLRAHRQGAAMALPDEPAWLGQAGALHLEAAEILGKHLSLYAWLGFKYPRSFPQGDRVPPLRARVSRYIEQALLAQSGFDTTTAEARALRRLTGHDDEYDW